jgi:DNA-binding IclR family transcriptional regulator
MSCGATLWAWERRGLEAVERLTLLAMADFAGPKCEVNASFETLCEQTDLEPAVVERALNNLQLCDLIEITTAGFRLCVNPDRLAYRIDARFLANFRLAQR